MCWIEQNTTATQVKTAILMLTWWGGGLIAIAYTADYIMYKLYTKMASLFGLWSYDENALFMLMDAIVTMALWWASKICTHVLSHCFKTSLYRVSDLCLYQCYFRVWHDSITFQCEIFECFKLKRHIEPGKFIFWDLSIYPNYPYTVVSWKSAYG